LAQLNHKPTFFVVSSILVMAVAIWLPFRSFHFCQLYMEWN